MDVRKFIQSLNDNERNELRKLLTVEISENFTDIDSFVNCFDITARLSNILTTSKQYLPAYIEQIERHDFMRLRNAGKKTWIEFTEWRYFIKKSKEKDRTRKENLQLEIN